jgi:hypothetical protein
MGAADMDCFVWDETGLAEALAFADAADLFGAGTFNEVIFKGPPPRN